MWGGRGPRSGAGMRFETKPGGVPKIAVATAGVPVNSRYPGRSPRRYEPLAASARPT